MTAHQRAILRNSRFALGETLYLLGQYDEALRAYQSAANAYPNYPEVLEAFAEIANVYKRKDRPTETRAALEQARLALRRIPQQADYTRTTNYDRKQWEEMLLWMCNLQP
jgi:tetratricopeptide (TPR) repeat protein